MAKRLLYIALILMLVMLQNTLASPIEVLSDSICGEISLKLQKEGLKFSKIQVDSPLEKYIIGKLIKDIDKNSSNELIFRLFEAEINYNQHSEQTYQRITNINATVLLKNADEKRLLLDKTFTFIDTCSYDEAKTYENELGINESRLPQTNGFYKKYLVPALVTTVAVVTALVFFTVRSK